MVMVYYSGSVRLKSVKERDMRGRIQDISKHRTSHCLFMELLTVLTPLTLNRKYCPLGRFI
jgi:hypothetical protein